MLYSIQVTDWLPASNLTAGVVINGMNVADLIRKGSIYTIYPYIGDVCFSDSSPMGAVLQYIKWLEVENHV